VWLTSLVLHLVLLTAGIALMLTAPASFALWLSATGDHILLYRAVQVMSFVLMVVCTAAAIYSLIHSSGGGPPFVC
jgi:hypothetical protein